MLTLGVSLPSVLISGLRMPFHAHSPLRRRPASQEHINKRCILLAYIFSTTFLQQVSSKYSTENIVLKV